MASRGGSAGVPRRETGDWEGDVDDMVAYAEEDDCAGFAWSGRELPAVGTALAMEMTVEGGAAEAVAALKGGGAAVF